ncbi:MAG: acetyl-CoA C-acyltransferase [Caulobacteraceae bacterium]|nr:acetyl-CoA C-acyltransferase [Caulobacteraceae bacterium]
MSDTPTTKPPIWLAAGVRTPFLKVDQAFGQMDAIALSVPVVRHMVGQLAGGRPDFAVWGAVIPNLTWSNIAREVLMDAGVDATIPAYSTVMACSTSMVGAFTAAGLIDGVARNLALVGGVESMSRVQIGISQGFSDWIRRFQQARTGQQRLAMLGKLKLSDLRLFIPTVTNRTSGMSMGQHTEITVKAWAIGRQAQDEIALASHQNAVAGWDRGFFDDLVIPVAGATRDTIPRRDTSLEKLGRLPPAFDRTSGKGTLTAGNSSSLTDGAAALWVASEAGLARLPAATPRARLVDYEVASVDFRTEGLLMAPAYAVPRMLARQGLTFADIDLWEVHEAFAGQVAFHIKAWESAEFLRDKAGVEPTFGAFPRDRLNPNGGSVALGHPFGATGARILSQAVKELSARPAGARAIVSICADGGQGTVALLQRD